jgi:hypothetical protein
MTQGLRRPLRFGRGEEYLSRHENKEEKMECGGDGWLVADQ